MPVDKHVIGHKALLTELEALETSKEPIFILFCGSKDAAGNSWCGDCVQAEPVVESASKSLPDTAIFIHCDVGDRSAWKDMNNLFRTDDKFKLTAVPTLVKWKTPERLVEDQCANANLVTMLFED